MSSCSRSEPSNNCAPKVEGVEKAIAADFTASLQSQRGRRAQYEPMDQPGRIVEKGSKRYAVLSTVYSRESYTHCFGRFNSSNTKSFCSATMQPIDFALRIYPLACNMQNLSFWQRSQQQLRPSRQLLLIVLDPEIVI